MAQQAVPNGMGQREFFLAQLATSLNFVVNIFSPNVDSVLICDPLSILKAVKAGEKHSEKSVVLAPTMKFYRPVHGQSNYSILVMLRRLKEMILSRLHLG